MTRTLYFARGLVVGSLLSVGIGLLTYLLFEFYCDNEEGNTKYGKNNSDLETEERERRKNIQKNAVENAVIEICLSDITSAISAIAGGATSIELCTSRAEGGITPYIGLIDEVVRISRGKDVQVHVLIRPRPGNFVYSAAEFDVMIRDVIAAKNAGADGQCDEKNAVLQTNPAIFLHILIKLTGVVVGILLENGNVDEDRMAVIRTISTGMLLTFHRAFDISANPKQALESIIKLGCDRLLSSGQSNTALEGLLFLTELSFLANNRIQIIAASNIDATNAFLIVRKSDINGVHAGSSVHTYFDANVDITRNDLVHTESKKNTNNDINKIRGEVVSKIEPKNENNVNSMDIKISDDDKESKLKLNALFGGYDCVSTEKVNELVTIVNTAWLLQSLEKNEKDTQPVTSVLNLPENDVKKIKSENDSSLDGISNANSADFSDDISLDNTVSKITTPAPIEASYVHVDSDSLNKKKSWMWLG